DTLYFSANDGSRGHELWAHDTSNASTWQVAVISSGGSGSNPGEYMDAILVGDTLYFSAHDGYNGHELWAHQPSEITSLSSGSGGGSGSGSGGGSSSSSAFAYANNKMSVGSGHTCAILDNGDLKCWGWDGAGQLGDGGSTNTNTNAPSSTAIDLGTGRTAVAVSSGSVYTCAILDNGDMKCWGYGASGNLGDGGSNTNTNAPSSTAINLGTGRTAVAMDAEEGHTCAILDNGDLKCWGSDRYGQLGDGGPIWTSGSPTDTNAPSSTAINLGTGRTAVAVSVGYFHTCAILDNGDLKCWGRDVQGVLGDGSTQSSNLNAPPSTAIDLGTGRTAVAVSAGYYHT
ncbi:hypothetical protein N9289_03225, partial [Candidatus Poseidonia sp.]|nr:hypothetical protein [Poseidonia sp.]